MLDIGWVHITLLWLDLTALMIGAVGAVAGRSPVWAWLLLLASGGWFPVNNSVLEGPTLIVLGHQHGVTLSDLLGLAGAVLAGARLWPRRGWSTTGVVVARVVVVLVVVGIGASIAAFVTETPQRVRRVPVHPPTVAAAPDQRNSLDILRSASTLPPV